MGVDQAIDITAAERSTLLALLELHLPNTTAWVYGSRAKGTSTPQSDLDLVVFSTPEQRRQVGDLREAFEESNLPFRVDLFGWDDVPNSFRTAIGAQHVALVNERMVTRSPKSVTASEWMSIRLGTACAKIGSGATPRGGSSVYLLNGPCAFIRSQNVLNDGFRRDGLAYISEEHASILANVAVIKHDVLLNITGDSVARVCQVDPEILPARVNQHVAIIRPNPENLVPRFLRYVLVSSEMQSRLLSWARAGGTRNALTKSMIESVDVLVPKDIHYQHAIAHILGTLDDKIELNRRMSATLEMMARALFKSWFVDFDPVRAKMEGRDTGLPRHIAELFPCGFAASEIGEVPMGWDVVPMSDIIAVNPTRRLRRGQIAPYLDMANMPTRGHTPHTVIDRPYGSGMRFTNGDTLVARITPCLENGKTAYVDFLQAGVTGWGSTEYIVMRPRSPLPTEFAYCLARSPHFRAFLIRNMSGTSGRQRVPAPALSQFMCVNPPSGIAQEFEKIVQPVMARASVAARESRRLSSLRDTLLPRLVAGEFRINRFMEEKD